MLWSGREDPDRLLRERERRRQTWRPPERPPLPPVRERFDLYLPQSYVHQRLWEQIRAQGAQSTTAEGVPAYRPVDHPYQGTIVVLPRDEREAKYGKPLMVADLPTPDEPERPPLLIVGAGALHWQEALELLAEARHYGLDRPERPDLPGRMTAVEAYRVWLDMAARRRRGQRTTGPGTFPRR